MKIIQSFAQFDDGCMYAGGRLNGSEVYLNFYTFFLSYLTLKKYYGAVTMFCNQKAYDTFIKYIPYDEIVIKENTHSQEFWSAYKIDVISEMTETFIHVDSDVFIFKDLFRPFIENPDKYDIIVQHTIPESKNFIRDFVDDNSKFINEINIIDSKKYDRRCFSCGTIGMNIKVKDQYIRDTKNLYNGIVSKKMIGNYDWIKGMILEELSLYLITLQHNFKWFDILPYDDILRLGDNGAGYPNKYTHMWFDTKFVKRNVELIKSKTKKDFPLEYKVVENYDKIITKYDIKYLSHTHNY